ncbi:MAG: hypothetical protein H7A37_01570 [Chlamydiales bacterium]|nr:hypothetical protein [Chlamydiia bacterium]MCP5506981.1 hypothetical protein [Chlamydiales bacterium]
MIANVRQGVVSCFQPASAPSPVSTDENICFTAREFLRSIDCRDYFQVCFKFDPQTNHLTLERSSQCRLYNSAEKLRAVIERDLVILVNGTECYGDSLLIDQSPITIRLQLKDILLQQFTYDPSTDEQVIMTDHRLSVYDFRRLSQRGQDYYPELQGRLTAQYLSTFEEQAPITDLHTHYGGAITVQSLLKIARSSDTPVLYPVALLKEMGIPFSGFVDQQGKIDLSDPKTSLFWEKFKKNLEMDPCTVSTFPDMEKVYKYRGPIVKNLDLFPRYLEELAKNYRSMGIRYAELSVSDIVDPKWMNKAIQILPVLEKQYGVQLRFLVGLWRHSPKLFNLDILEKVIAYEHNPYIVGIDFMGQESNSTRDFTDLLDMAAEYKKNKRPDCVIRVHAGESACHPENITEAIKHGATRIGHGIHGLNSDVFDLAKKNGTVIEINISSNSSLLSVTIPAKEIPIQRFIDEGVNVTIGTDGHGCYGTDSRTEYQIAYQLGLQPRHFRKIREFNEAYVASMQRYFDQRMENPEEALAIPQFCEPKCPKDEWQKVQIRKQEERRSTEEVLKSKGKIFVEADRVADYFRDKIPVNFSGASSVSWRGVLEEDRALVRKQLIGLFDSLNPEKVVIVTGGTDFGLEKIVHEVVSDYRLAGKNFTLIGTVATQLRANPNTISDSLTHATVVDYSWYDIGPFVMKWVQAKQGISFFMGGGDVVKNMIHTARMLGIEDFYVLKDIHGSSQQAAEIYPDHAFSKYNCLGTMLSKSRNHQVINRLTFSKDDAITYTNVKKGDKDIVSFIGFSSPYPDRDKLNHCIEEALEILHPNDVIIAAGATEVGIGAVYPIAKKKGFETLGIVSTNAKHSNRAKLSESVDFIAFIEDEQWGGYLPDSKLLSPVSEVIVTCSEAAIVIGGNEIATIEAAELKKRNKDIIFLKEY